MGSETRDPGKLVFHHFKVSVLEEINIENKVAWMETFRKISEIVRRDCL